jgi:hypothetical protein
MSERAIPERSTLGRAIPERALPERSTLGRSMCGRETPKASRSISYDLLRSPKISYDLRKATRSRARPATRLPHVRIRSSTRAPHAPRRGD